MAKRGPKSWRERVMPEIWHTAASAARYLNISRPTFYGLIYAGHIRPHIVTTVNGNKNRYAQSDLDRLQPREMTRAEYIFYEASREAKFSNIR